MEFFLEKVSDDKAKGELFKDLRNEGTKDDISTKDIVFEYEGVYDIP